MIVYIILMLVQCTNLRMFDRKYHNVILRLHFVSSQGCLGALDGTYINVQVQNIDKPRYRTRKGQISTNTLAVCDRNLCFVYVLPGWEGSAADGRVLRDAVNRVNGLKVPRGN